MADHFSGPRAVSDPAADITDVFTFPSPERPGHLVVVLDVNPAAAPTSLFSDALHYRVRVRPVTAAGADHPPAFSVGDDERLFDITFSEPKANGNEGSRQTGTCVTPAGAEVSFEVGDTETVEAHGVRVFGGVRLEPFFIDLAAEVTTQESEQLAFRPKGENLFTGFNVLSIVLEIDVAKHGLDGPLLGVVCETVTRGEPSVRIERMGRPEVKNVILGGKKFDTVNRGLEVRDLYNAEDAFNLSDSYVQTYRARFDSNLAFFDRLDGKADWPPDDRGSHPLTELLLADFLVVDISRPFADDGFLEIETAMLAGRPHTTCGGRWPNQDILDKLYTVLVGGVDGPPITESVSPETPVVLTFPYLRDPNPNPPDLKAVLAAVAESTDKAA